MGEALASGVLIYEEPPNSTLTVEFWDRDDPEAGDEPRVNITAEDHNFDRVATAGLNFEQVRALHFQFGKWLADHDAPRSKDARS